MINKNISILILFIGLLILPIIPTWAVLEPEQSDEVFLNLHQATGLIQDSLTETIPLPIRSFSQEEVVPVLETIIDQNRQRLLESVTVDALEHAYLAKMENKNNGTEMAVVEWKQNFEGIKIDVPGVRAVLKYIPEATQKYSVVLMSSILVQPSELTHIDTADQSSSHLEKARKKTQEDLGASIFQERMIRFRDGTWNVEYGFIFEKRPDQKYTVRGNEVFVTSTRKHLKDPSISGDVQGMGHAGTYTNPNLDVLKLIDLVVSIGTTVQYTNPLGQFSFLSLASGLLRANLEGRWAKVIDKNHPVFSFSGNGTSNQPINIFWNNANQNEYTTAQIDGYYHTTYIHNWLKQYLPNFTAIDKQMEVEVNADKACGASHLIGYSTIPHRIYFGGSGGLSYFGRYYSCPNMAEDDVIYHEYIHFLEYVAGHSNGMDGWEDLIGVLITDDPITGNLIELAGRTAENHFKYPNGHEPFSHDLGMAWQGFVWDLRKKFINLYGPEQGKARLKNLVVPTILANSLNIPTNVVDVLLFDDNDNNLGNGTPHFYEIITAASQHNLFPFPQQQVSWLNSPLNNTLIDRTRSSSIQIDGRIKAQNMLANFKHYQVFYGIGDDPQSWIPITPTLITVPTNGILASWNVSSFPSGTYC